MAVASVVNFIICHADEGSILSCYNDLCSKHNTFGCATRFVAQHDRKLVLQMT